jgi:hypothetical protein
LAGSKRKIPVLAAIYTCASGPTTQSWNAPALESVYRTLVAPEVPSIWSTCDVGVHTYKVGWAYAGVENADNANRNPKNRRTRMTNLLKA